MTDVKDALLTMLLFWVIWGPESFGKWIGVVAKAAMGVVNGL